MSKQVTKTNRDLRKAIKNNQKEILLEGELASRIIKLKENEDKNKPLGIICFVIGILIQLYISRIAGLVLISIGVSLYMNSILYKKYRIKLKANGQIILKYIGVA